MERAAFTLLHESERSWWYRGRAAVVRAVLSALPARPGSVLDFGAGYGGMHDTFARYGTVYAFEPDPEARAVAATRGYAAVFDAPETALSRPYGLIALCDVLEHMNDDRTFLLDAHRTLVPDGRLLITVPALSFLWSVHDEVHHHYRRYTARSLRAVLSESGYVVERMSYWNFFLFLPAAFARLLGKGGESSFRLPRVLDAFFFSLVRFEAFLLRFVPFPVGVSLVVLARKK